MRTERNMMTQHNSIAIVVWAIYAILWGLFGVVMFGDIGFDLGGRFGLDFGDFVKICFVYTVLLVCDLILAFLGNLPRLGVLLLASAVFHVLVFFFG